MLKSLKDISWLVDEPTYRADKALSYSTISKFKREGFEHLDTLFDKVESPSLLLGSLVDCLTTDPPEEYERRYLVAEAFLDNPENKPYIDHIDTIPSNNLLSNLRWVTPLENQNNPKTLKRLQDSLTRYNRSLKHKYQVQNAMGKAVTLLNINKDFIKDYPTLSEAALDLSTSIGTINRRCKSGNIFRGKYYLKFKEYAEKS